MPFTEVQEYDVTVRPTGHIEVRRSDVVLRDGAEIARTYHRHIVTPGDDVTGEIQIVQDIALSMWTQEMIEAAQQPTDE